MITKTTLWCLVLLFVVQVIDATSRPASKPAQCFEPRIRRAWRAISPAERNLFLEALFTAKQQGHYDQFIALHKSATNAIYSHGTSLFLPWHRWYIYQFENFLRSLSPRFKCLTIPYWDWEKDAGRESASRIFDGNLGYIRSGNTSVCVRDGLFSVRSGWVIDGRCLKREYDPKITFMGEVGLMVMLSQPVYSDFRVDLEARAHGAPHAWLNGDMGDFTSPNDPMFFLHHSNIDRLWSMWQDCHDYDKVDAKKIIAGKNYNFYEPSDPSFGDILEPMPYTYLNGKLEPFLHMPGTQKSPSVRDIFHIMDNTISGLHYGYDPADNLVALFNRLNPAMCKWDWFLGAPTEQNKNTWGVSWLKRLSKAPRITTNVLTLNKEISTKRYIEDEQDAKQEWFTEQLSANYQFNWKYLNATHFRMRIQTLTQGWAAVGFNPQAGGMSKSDMVIISNNGNGIKIGDYFSETYGMPELDAQQSISDAVGEMTGTGTWMEFTRAFKTNDSQDKDVAVNAENTIVWAHGSTPYVTKHDNSARSFKKVLFPENVLAFATPVPNPAPVQKPVEQPVQQPVELAQPITEQIPQISVPATISGSAQLAKGYFLGWKIEKSDITFSITLTPSAFTTPRHHTTTLSPVIPSVKNVGWVALGFQPDDKGMANADIVVAHIKENLIFDYISTGYQQPQKDTATGNKDDISSPSITVFPNMTIQVSFTRKLVTGDLGDRPLLPGKMDVIWAFGPAGFSKHWVTSKGVAVLDFFDVTIDPKCPAGSDSTVCVKGHGKCNNGTCECFMGWTGPKCESAAAFPNIPIKQQTNTQLLDTLRRLKYKNGINIPAGAPGNRDYRKYIFSLFSRAYDSFAKPTASSPRIERLWTQVFQRNPITRKLAAKDKLSILVLGECAVTAGPGRQYVSDDWLNKNGQAEQADKNWEPACPTKTCCNTTKMISDKLVCKGGGIAQPTCDPTNCTWKYDCTKKVSVFRGKNADVIVSRVSPVMTSRRLPLKSKLTVFSKLNSTGEITAPQTRRPITARLPVVGKPGQRPITVKPGQKPTGRPVQRPVVGKPGQRPAIGKPVQRPATAQKPTGRPVQRPVVGKPGQRPATGKPVQRPVTGKPGQRPITVKPGQKPTGRPVQRPTGRPATPGQRPTGRPFGRPTNGTISRPFGRPVGRPFGRPTSRPTGRPFGRPFGRPTNGTISRPFGRPVGRPFGRPTNRPVGRPVGRLFGRPFGRPANGTISRPFGRTVGRPFGRPTNRQFGRYVGKPGQRTTGAFGRLGQRFGRQFGKPTNGTISSSRMTPRFPTWQFRQWQSQSPRFPTVRSAEQLRRLWRLRNFLRLRMQLNKLRQQQNRQSGQGILGRQIVRPEWFVQDTQRNTSAWQVPQQQQSQRSTRSRTPFSGNQNARTTRNRNNNSNNNRINNSNNNRRNNIKVVNPTMQKQDLTASPVSNLQAAPRVNAPPATRASASSLPVLPIVGCVVVVVLIAVLFFVVIPGLAALNKKN